MAHMIDSSAVGIIIRACGCHCLIKPDRPYTEEQWNDHLRAEAKIPCTQHLSKKEPKET